MNRGCIPVKALVRSAEISHLFQRASEFGFRGANAEVDFEAVFSRKDRVVATLSHGEEILERRGIDLLRGEASFVSPERIEVGGRPVDARKFIISSGSEPAIPDIPGLKETGFWTSNEALNPTRQPASLIIIGGSAVGCELAQVYSRLGTKVSVLEVMPRLVAHEEPRSSEILAQALTAEGIELFLEAKVTGFAGGQAAKTVYFLAGGQESSLSADEILVAVGRSPGLDGLGLDNAGVDFDSKGIKVDRSLRTSQPHIWASGDAIGEPMLAHFATYEGRLAGSNSVADEAGIRQADYRVVPRAVFTDPPLASVGLSEEAARAAGHEVASGIYRFSETGRGVAMGETRGQVKLVADKGTRKLLGAHIIGPWADALIHETVVAMGSHLTIDDLQEPRAIHIHPTLAEAVTWAADEIR